MATTVSNPLTIVAIFAGLAEAFATIALVNVPHDIQQVFVYFVMGFPALIVLLFFSVLNWNHTVLYAPSDFDDESMYLESIRIKALKTEIIGTLKATSDDSVPLTSQQVEAVSERVTNVVETATVSPRRQQILFLLNHGRISARSISRNLDLSEITVLNHLKVLAAEGRVERLDVGGSELWQLLPISR